MDRQRFEICLGDEAELQLLEPRGRTFGKAHRPRKIRGLAKVAAKEKAADAGKSEAGAERWNHAIGPRQELHFFHGTDNQPGEKAAEKPTVRDEPALPHFENIEKVIEAIEVGEDVEEARAEHRTDRRRHVDRSRD